MTQRKSVVNPDPIVNNLPAIEALIAQLLMVKSGYKTTEFWVTVVVDAAALLGGFFPADSVPVRVASALVAVVTTIGYVLARAQVKSAARAAAGKALLLSYDHPSV